MDIAKRLTSKVEIVDGHWLWRGTLSWNGYGLIMVDDKLRRAHAVSYETFVGPIPPGKCVLHKDNCTKHRDCICPDHLYPGDRKKNSEDCFRTGGRGRSRLTDSEVIKIRLSLDPYAKLAEKFRISPQAVSQIKHGHTWKTVAPNIKGVISPMARKMHPQPREIRGSSRLSDQDVLDIRASSLPRKELAVKYGLTPQSISHILKRHTFKQVAAREESP